IQEDQAALYDFGPSQAGGPSLRLPYGTVVKVVRKERGWTRVELENGMSGYVGNDQLRPAELADFAPPGRSASQLASLGSGSTPAPWAPAPPPPDLPNMPHNPDLDGALLLLPPLEAPGSPGRAGAEPPVLQPGDALPPL